MRIFGPHWLMHGVAKEMRRVALIHPYYDGLGTQSNMRLIDNCRAAHLITGTRLIFTRDEGMHTSGWWKNPDYERCWHLSLSFIDPITQEIRDKDEELTEQWLDAFYGDEKRKLWAEPPYTEHGKASKVWHYRLFCDRGWQPIIPRGEVYSKDWTPAGWLSYSDMKDAKARALQDLVEAGPGEQ